MKQVFLKVNSGEIEIIETPKPTVKKNHVIVETMYSAISPGTEGSLAKFGEKNLLQKIKERPDQAKQVLDKMRTDGIINTVESAFNRLKEPLPLGYSAMGKVLEVGEGVSHVKKDDYVAIAGTAYHSEINRVGKNLVVKISKDMDNKKETAFCALGAIALHSIHQADIQPGETVGIIGLGLLGHITARILNSYGSDVIAYDIKSNKNSQTQLLGFITANDDDALEQTLALTNNRKIDKVIITASTESNAPIELATNIIQNKGKICMVGVTKMDIDRSVFYEKELDFTIARSYGPGRYNQEYEDMGIDFPTEYVRFSEGSNISEFIRLIERKKITLDDLISKVISLNQVKEIYSSIFRKQNRVWSFD